MYTAKCSQCSKKFRHKTRTELLSAIRKHLWKAHRSWMISRIKAGRKGSADKNPTLAMWLGMLALSATAGMASALRMSDRHWNTISAGMSALLPVLPKPVTVNWAIVEAARSAVKRIKK